MNDPNRYSHRFRHRNDHLSARVTGDLRECLAAARNIQPLPANIVTEITALQRRWSDDVDVHAEPWSM
jgi:hypothetical protein